MRDFFRKPYRWAAVCAVLLTGVFVFALLDTFVIPKAVTHIPEEATDPAPDAEDETDGDTPDEAGTEAVVTDASYEDGNISIRIETLYRYDSYIYVADIRLADASYLKTALAGDTFGRNIKEVTSAMAGRNNAIFAVNGDYYGFRSSGYVLRNGVVYRGAARDAGDDESLVIDSEGDFSVISESETALSSLDADGISQIFSFGPALVEDGEIAVDSGSEVARSKNSNPRTAIGQAGPLHYIVVVSDGRTSESEGLSLLELAELMKELGCSTAYNLDGGGSSTMVFNGRVVNNPTDGRSEGERKVSDIVYIGY